MPGGIEDFEGLLVNSVLKEYVHEVALTGVVVVECEDLALLAEWEARGAREERRIGFEIPQLGERVACDGRGIRRRSACVLALKIAR